MTELIALFQLGVETFGARVRAVDDAQWSAATPCDEWTVADLVRHLVDEHRWLPPLLHGRDLDAAGKIVASARELPDDGGTGANAAQEWHEASIASVDVTREPDAIEREVDLSRGPTPAREYLTEMIFDLTVHSWDLQRAIGFTDPIPDELVDCAQGPAEQFGDASGSGMFKATVDVPDDAAPIDRLVARTGRHPDWTAPSRQ